MAAMHPPDAETMYPIGDAARRLGVSIDTIRKWDREGKIISIRTPGNQRRYPSTEIDRLIQNGAACHVCGQGYDVNDPWEHDHDIPLSRGGTNAEGNIKLCHRSCNREKSSA